MYDHRGGYMPEEALTYVAICPVTGLKQDSIFRIADLLHKDPNYTRFMLLAEVPRLAAHFSTKVEAEALAFALKAEGLKTFNCSESELRQACTPFPGHSLNETEGHVVFTSRARKNLSLDPANIRLILKGIKNTRTQHDETQVSRKLNITATALTGGIPLFKNIKKVTTVSETASELFVRLYDDKDSQPLVEILQRSFDYSFLGTKLTPSSLANLNTAALEMKRLFPQAVLDERLTRPVVAETALTSGWDMHEVNCRLVYMSYFPH
jgi:hypothetical protein